MARYNPSDPSDADVLCLVPCPRCGAPCEMYKRIPHAGYHHVCAHCGRIWADSVSRAGEEKSVGG